MTLFCACDCPDCEGERHVIHAEPGAPRVVADPRCPECVARRPHVEHTRYARPEVAIDVPIRSERDRLTPELERELVTESEQRALWGDR